MKLLVTRIFTVNLRCIYTYFVPFHAMIPIYHLNNIFFTLGNFVFLFHFLGLSEIMGAYDRHWIFWSALSKFTATLLQTQISLNFAGGNQCYFSGFPYFSLLTSVCLIHVTSLYRKICHWRINLNPLVIIHFHLSQKKCNNIEVLYDSIIIVSL
jgi:hypothetical protein